MSTYVTLEDFGTWSGTPVAPDQASEIQFLLNEAEVELEVIAGDLGDRIDNELTTAERVKLALCGMVGRVLRDHADEMLLLGSQDVLGARQKMSSWLHVGRRERHLVGLYASGGSLDLSTRDPQLVCPTRRPPLWRPDEWRYCP